MADNDNGLRVRKAYIVICSTSIVIETQDITNGFIKVFSLIEQGLSVKCRKVFIEID